MDEAFLQECQSLVDEVSEKFGYDSQDEENNYSLKTVLGRIVPIILRNSSKEGKELFFQMLRHTPIVVAEKLTKEQHDELESQYIGKPNPHIKDGEESDLGEYDTNDVPAGAYVSEPIISEDGTEVLGKKSFLFMQKVGYGQKDFFGTDINVSHLIHELGHAWHAEHNEYTINYNGQLVHRVGTAEFLFSLDKQDDGSFIRNSQGFSGLMTEEAMNTVAEENAMAEYKGISQEEMTKAYNQVLVPSNYQVYMTNMVRYMLDKLGKDDFEAWRLTGDAEAKSRIESLMSRTDYWKNREAEILPDSGSNRSYSLKRKVIAEMPESTRLKEFFKKYEDVYFPDVSSMSPLEKIDNVLTQRYNINNVKYSMGIESFKAILERFTYEGYGLIKQTFELKTKEDLEESLGDVRLSEVSDVTAQTKDKAVTKDEKIEATGEK